MPWPKWFETEAVQDLPILMRGLALWSRFGLKRNNSLVLGGSYLFSKISGFYRWRPVAGNNLVPVRWAGSEFRVVIDLLDFQVINHTLPLLSGLSVEARLLQMLLPQGGCFVDIGANYGVYSLLASKLGANEVLAFEPQPRLVQAMKESIRINKMQNIELHECALGADDGECRFFIPSRSSGIGSIYESHVLQGGGVRSSIFVKVKSLDKILDNMNLDSVDVIKIDVEGSELQVLSGAVETLSRYLPFVWFELNPAAIAANGSEQSSLFEVFHRCGYMNFFSTVGVVHGFLKPAGLTNQLMNVLAVPDAKMPLLKALLEGRRSRCDSFQSPAAKHSELPRRG